jgi:hypothetical protein
MLAYRITDQIAALFRQGERERLRPLQAGAILFQTSQPDASGLIEATYEGHNILVFSRDLAERSQPIDDEAFVVWTGYSYN